jgi:hypothetical protein
MDSTSVVSITFGTLLLFSFQDKEDVIFLRALLLYIFEIKSFLELHNYMGELLSTFSSFMPKKIIGTK